VAKHSAEDSGRKPYPVPAHPERPHQRAAREGDVGRLASGAPLVRSKPADDKSR
jgi:hypothetical protein